MLKGNAMAILDDKNIQIYPLTAWFELVDNLHKGKRDDLLLRKFLMKLEKSIISFGKY